MMRREGVAVGSYLVELSSISGHSLSGGQDEAATAEITEIIDFYLSRYDGWCLELVFGSQETIEVASRSPESLAGSETYVAERTIIDSCGEECSIRLRSTL